VPEDCFLALNEAVEIAGEQTIVELDAKTHLFLLELNRITKTGGIHIPFVAIE
jgi:hypothetical protein